MPERAVEADLSRGINATLWAENADLTAILKTVFALADIGLDVVGTAEALTQAATRARDADFLLIDCSQALPHDVARCADVLAQTELPVHIIHPRADTVESLRTVARGDLEWVDPFAAGLGLLEKLRLLRAAADRGRPLGPHLTERERDVWRLVALGRSDAEIGRGLSLSLSTLKREVARVKAATGLNSRRDLIAIYYRSGAE